VCRLPQGDHPAGGSQASGSSWWEPGVGQQLVGARRRAVVGARCWAAAGGKQVSGSSWWEPGVGQQLVGARRRAAAGGSQVLGSWLAWQQPLQDISSSNSAVQPLVSAPLRPSLAPLLSCPHALLRGTVNGRMLLRLLLSSAGLSGGHHLHGCGCAAPGMVRGVPADDASSAATAAAATAALPPHSPQGHLLSEQSPILIVPLTSPSQGHPLHESRGRHRVHHWGRTDYCQWAGGRAGGGGGGGGAV